MATITNRGPHQFQAIVRRKGYPTQTKTFEKKLDAQMWATEIESNMIRGTHVDRSILERTTLGNLIERYAKVVTPRKKSATKELGLISRWLKNPLALRPLCTLNNADFAKYSEDRMCLVSASSVRTELSLISSIYDYAKENWSLPVINLVAPITKPELPDGRTRRLVADEESRLLTAAAKSQAPTLKFVIQLAIETGMRAGEILAITWGHINIANGVINLNDSKNGTPRTVPLTQRAENLLRAQWRPIVSSVRLTSFHDSNGLSAAFRRTCARAGIDGLRFHDLRHEAASRLAPGMEALTLAKVMGWKTIQMAMIYYNPTDKELVTAVRKAVESRG